MRRWDTCASKKTACQGDSSPEEVHVNHLMFARCSTHWDLGCSPLHGCLPAAAVATLACPHRRARASPRMPA
eukprot:155385-Prymnesium_polylepis.1